MIFYTIGCPQCDILETKLQQANLEYVVCTDKDLMLTKNIESVPMLELDSGEMLSFAKAVKWVKEQSK